jgi:hypothetical protein
MYCRDLIGPLIGHASDGDGCHRELIQKAYTCFDTSLQRQYLG